MTGEKLDTCAFSLDVSEWYGEQEDRLRERYADREFDPGEDPWEFEDRFVEDGEWHCYRRTRPGEDYCLFHAHESETGVEGDAESDQVLRDIVNATTGDRLWNDGTEGLWEVPRHPPELDEPFDRDEYKRREKQFVGASLGAVELSYEDLDGPDSYPIDLRLSTAESLDFSRSRIGHGLFLDGLRQTKSRESIGEDGDEYGIELKKSRVAGSFRMVDAQCVAGVSLRASEATVVSLNRTDVDGDVHASYLQSSSIYMHGTDVGGDLSLNVANTSESLRLKGVDIDGDLSLRRADVDYSVRLDHATVDGSIDAADIETGKTLRVTDADIEGDFSANRSSVGNVLNLRGTTVAGVTLDYASVAGSVKLDDGTVGTEANDMDADVTLVGVDLSGNLQLDGTDIKGDLLARKAEIVGVISGEGLTVGGTVRFVDSKIDDTVYLRGSDNSYGGLTLRKTDLRSFALGGHVVDGDVVFNSLSAPNGFGIADATVDGDVTFRHVDFGTGLEISELTVGGDLGVSWAEISGGFHARLIDVNVDGSVRFSNCSLDADHRFEAVETGGQLAVVDTDVKGELHFDPETEIGGPLHLRGTAVSELVADCTLTHPAVGVVSLDGAAIGSATLAVNHGGGGPQPIYDLEDATVGDIDLPMAESANRTKAFERLRFLGTTFDGFVFSERREQFRQTDWQAHRPRDGGYEDIAVVTQSVEKANGTETTVFEAAREVAEAAAGVAVADTLASARGDESGESDSASGHLSEPTTDGASTVSAYLDGEFGPGEPADSPGGDPFAPLVGLFESSPDPEHDPSREWRAVAEKRLEAVEEDVGEALDGERMRRAAALPYSAADRVEMFADTMKEAIRDPTAGDEPTPAGSLPSYVDPDPDGPLTTRRLGNAVFRTLALSPSAVTEIAASAPESEADRLVNRVADGGVSAPVTTLCEAWNVDTGPSASEFDMAVRQALADVGQPLAELAAAIQDDHERLVELGLVSPEVSEDGPNTDGAHSYGAIADALVNRSNVSNAEFAAEELARDEPRYRRICERIGVSLENAEEAVARDLADYRTAMGTNNELESTYALAKNGASEAGDETAAGNFFQREAGYARRQHWQRLGGVGAVSKVLVALVAAAGALAFGLPSVSSLSSGTLPAFSPVVVLSVAFALACPFYVREELAGSLKWVGNTFLWLTMGYGEKPTRVLGLSVAVVGTFALAYWGLNASVPSVAGSSELGHLVFSLDMFVTLALDNPTAGNSLVRLLAVFEGFLGVFVIGMFVVAVTRAVHR